MRNNFYSSFNTGEFTQINYQRSLIKDGHEIKWKHVEACFQRDQENRYINATRLTLDHMKLDSRKTMNNKLANDIFSNRIIRDIETFEKESAIGTLWFLRWGNCFKNIMRSDEPITSPDDQRLSRLEVLMNDMQDWKNENLKHNEVLTDETIEDSILCCQGFSSMCKELVNFQADIEIVPLYCTQDIVENYFSLQ